MTVAQQGLRQALARGASGSVLAIAEMKTEDLLAGMSDEQKAELAASLAASAPAPAAASMEPGEDDPKCSKCGDPMKDGKCKKCSSDASAEASASDDPVATARAEERKRFTAVMSSEHYKGREALAATLLANDKLGADDIIAALASANASNAESSADAEAGAAMLKAMQAMGNPDTTDSGKGQQQEADFGWGKIHAEVRERRGR